MNTQSLSSRALLSGIALTFVAAKGCIGGDVSLGSDGAGAMAGATIAASGGGTPASAGATGIGGRQATASPCQVPAPLAPCTGFSIGYSFDPGRGACEPYCSSNAVFTSLEACEASCGSASASGGSSGGAADLENGEAPLTVDSNGQVTSSADLGVSGVVYTISDSVGLDLMHASGDCEVAGHAVAECANVVTPPLAAGGTIDWSLGGLLCTSGTVEALLDVPGTPGTVDYASMWGAGMAFNFADNPLAPVPFDASAHGVIGIAFDIDRVPARGLRVEFTTPSSADAPDAWQPSSQNLTSPVRPGHNIVLFQDVTALPFYADQSPLDPTQILAMQFHVPTTTSAADYQFCLHDLALVLGTPPPPVSSNGCPRGELPNPGYEYDASNACVSAYATELGCSEPDSAANAVPSAPAIDDLPCVRRLADGALFLAFSSSTGPLAWQTQASSTWSRLPPTEWGECSADEAALVASATVCPVTLP